MKKEIFLPLLAIPALLFSFQEVATPKKKFLATVLEKHQVPTKVAIEDQFPGIINEVETSSARVTYNPASRLYNIISRNQSSEADAFSFNAKADLWVYQKRIAQDLAALVIGRITSEREFEKIPFDPTRLPSFQQLKIANDGRKIVGIGAKYAVIFYFNAYMQYDTNAIHLFRDPPAFIDISSTSEACLVGDKHKAILLPLVRSERPRIWLVDGSVCHEPTSIVAACYNDLHATCATAFSNPNSISLHNIKYHTLFTMHCQDTIKKIYRSQGEGVFVVHFVINDGGDEYFKEIVIEDPEY